MTTGKCDFQHTITDLQLFLNRSDVFNQKQTTAGYDKDHAALINIRTRSPRGPAGPTSPSDPPSP